jgi:ElaB/YqjD/DUF883 family membrane-anchored ribosome-binding protein
MNLAGSIPEPYNTTTIHNLAEKIMRKYNDSSTSTYRYGELQQLIDRAQLLVDATADKLDEGVQSARDALLGGLEDARWKAIDLEDELRDRAEQAQTFVQENPYQAVGFSFVAGLFVGWILSK